MDITELRNKTAAVQAAKESVENSEFINSPLKACIDSKIQEAADRGESTLSLEFYCLKQRKLGSRYGGPMIDTVIRHYQNEGFIAWPKYWWAAEGYSNVSLNISWR